MSKFSVKKPITIFVIVIVIIALGVVSVIKMTPDLLPSIDLPYVVVMTTYPGATPKEVETTVTKPLEQNLSTVEDLKNILSMSNANFSLVIMEFENGSSMDTAVVNTLQAVDLVEGAWPEMVGSPYIMKINPNMLPISVISVDRDGYDIEQLSNFVKDDLVNKLEGTTGVASVSTGGIIQSEINVKINEEKIDELNNKLISEINSEMAKARKQIKSGISQIDTAQKDLTKTRDSIIQGQDSLPQIDEAIAAMEQGLTDLENAHSYGVIDDETYAASLETLNAQLASMKETKVGILEGIASLDQIDAGIKELKTQKSKLNKTLSDLNKQAEKAVKNTDVGALISAEMVANILKAQNFSMPAGYVQENDVQYLVSVGDKVTDLEEAKQLFLFNADVLGDVRLQDVADVFMVDNSDEVYASINGNPGVLLTFSKQSNYATAKVSDNLKDKFAALEGEYSGLHFTTLMDQGDYIYLIIGAILESLLYGALFAVVILFLFLKDIRPTFITLLSIPISIMLAIALMYFTGVTLNMISLSGLAVAVGMLVDNSIVVIENIFRLRRLGVPPKKAAIAGAKEVGAAIISSTLTTVCVFAPIVFVTGLTRQLFADMALTITYALGASLLIALTLVPSMSSLMFKKDLKPEGRGFVKFKNAYRRLLNWNLNHKAVVLLMAVVLLGYSVYASVSKGFIFIPDMSTPQMTGSLTMNDEEATVEDTAEVCDEALERLSKVEGVETVGAMLSSSGLEALTGGTSSNTVSLYVIVDQSSKASGKEIADNCEAAVRDLPCEVEILSSSSITSYTSALGGSGVTINLFSTETDLLQSAAKIMGEALEKVDGIYEVNNGLTDAEPELHFTVDRDKAMKKGLTVAQVYMAVSEAISTTTTATTLSMDGTEYEIIVAKPGEAMISAEAIKNLEIDYTDAQGKTGTVKLSDIAECVSAESLPSIQRSNQRVYLSVTGLVDENHNVTLVTAAAQEAMKSIQIPAGVSYEFDGESEMIMDAIYDLLTMMGLGVLLVYLIMVAQFQSLKSPFIVMFTIPLAFTGGLLALLIFGKEISIVAMIGLILLVGVIVNNGIVLVDYTNQLRARGLTKRQAIIESAATRMRPVMMTSLTTILGLIIMAVGKTAGTDMMQPIALVCIGGLLYATLLTLLVVPVIYDIFNGEKYEATKEEDLDITGLIAE